jgi:hypothetical protein|tara:strand:- start:87 stop:281 length:195 start_codon:yes stop_codon:yes gene_type:complete
MTLNKLIQRYGGDMIANKGGKDTTSKQTILGREGACHRIEHTAVPHGLNKIEEEIWRLRKKKKK